MLQDLRFALRVLRRSPGFAALAVVTLALGIGATVTMFSVADAVLIRPLPYRDPARLVQIWGQNLARNIPFHQVEYADVSVWRQEARSFEGLSAAVSLTASLAGRGDPETVQVTRANAELLPLLGITMAAGRSFLPEEDHPGAGRVVVITHGLWQRRFGGSPAAVGDSIKLDGVAHTIVGVLPAGFRSPTNPVDVLVPLADDGARGRENPPTPTVTVFGRLRPGVTREQAQAEMDQLSRGLDKQFPSPVRARSVRVWGLSEFRTRDVRVSLLVLAGAVTMVLLIACVNVANLLLARAGLRRGEVAIRAALGARRRRLVLQLLTENLIVGLGAGVLGLVAAHWGVQALRYLVPARVPSLDQAGIDLRAVSFALLASLITVVLFGLGPALALANPRAVATLQSGMKDQGRGHGRRLGRGLRDALVAAEVALSIMLLVGAILLIQSFARLQQVNPGFDPTGVLSATVTLNAERYREPGQSAAFFRRFLEELERTPGVVAAGITSSLPLSGHNQGTYVVGESGAVTGLEDAPVTWFRRVSAGYFRAIGIPLLRGRLFDTAEERNPGTVIVNQAMAEWYWPGRDPIGQHLRGGSPDPRAAGPWLTVVGVVGNVHHMALTAAFEPEMYLPYIATPSRSVAVAVRTTLKPESLAPVLAGVARAIDPEQAVSTVRTLEAAVYDAAASERLSTALLGLFAALAVLLAVVGLSGVTSYIVDQRTHEIGIRMALGARRADVLRLVFRDGMLATTVGVVVGLAGAAAATSLMGAMLFGVSARSPLAFAAAPLLLVIGALAGIWLPARRATAIDPLAALREP